MKKILNITLAAAFACAMTGCQDFLDTSSPSVVDRDFVFSNEESARGALQKIYNLTYLLLERISDLLKLLI